MTDVLNYIKNKLVESHPDADIREGSALNDLLISPLESILRPYAREHEALIDFLTLKDPESMSETEMDHLASNFFISRNLGSKVTGNVRIYFDRAVSVDIPRGTKFTTSAGLNFYTKLGYSINKVEMAANVEGSLYHTGDILVEAETQGEEYSIAANEITTISNISKVPSRVRNVKAFKADSVKETNAQLADRIKDTFINNSLSSSYGIKKTLNSLYNGIRDIEVIGAGSASMKRDIISVPSENISNYFGKRPNAETYPDVRSSAYFKVWNAYDPTVPSGVYLPQIDDFEREFISYRNIWRNDSLDYPTEDEKIIEDENFNGDDFLISGLGSGVYVNKGWILSDPAYGITNHNPFAFSVISEKNSIRLGINLNNIPEQASFDLALVSEIGRLLNKVRDGYNDLIDVARVGQIIEQLKEGTNPAVVYNYSPVFHRYISLNAGIAITGKFHTTSTSDDNIMSYITVHRNNGVIAPHDGFGLAWKPGNGDTYNVYLVDNNVLQDDIYVGKNMIVEDYGVNNFISAHKLDIKSDNWYEFRIEITNKYGVNAWIRLHPENDGGEGPGAGVDTTTNPDVQFGETFGYRPVANDQGSHFGVSVAGTTNEEWLYGDIGIQVIEDNYPLHMFKMYLDPDYFDPGDEVAVNYYGVGEGLDASDVIQTNSLKLYMYNHTSSNWEELGGHDNNTNEDKLAYVVSGIAPTFIHNSDYVSSDYAYLIAATDTMTQPRHRIRTFYVEMVKGDGSHVGNHADIFVDSPVRISETSYTGTVQNGSLSFTGVGPVQEIKSVAVDGGPTLEESEWTSKYLHTGDAFGQGATIQVIPTAFNENGTNLVITYRYLSDGSSMQSTVSSDSFRSPSQDNLIKVMPAYTIEIENLTYTGNVTTAEMKSRLKTYINESTFKTVSISNIVSEVLSNGATSVDIPDISINIRYSDLTGRQYSLPLVNNYTITGIGNFFTDISDLSGVSQL